MPKELDVDKMLQAVDQGKGPGTMGQSPKFTKQYINTVPSPQPKQEPMPQPKSYAPAGAGFKKLPSNIGLMTQKETLKAFGNPIKKSGPNVDAASYLPYRKPAIEGGEGPHAV